MRSNSYQAVVIGASAGGLKALSILLPVFPADLPLAIIVVNHRMATPDTYLTDYLGKICSMQVRDAEHLGEIEPKTIYIAPPGYHLLVADDYCFNLTVDDRVNSSRPSIDVTFETAAEVYGQHLIGVVLTGANSDGAAGLATIKKNLGYAMAQDPKTAESNIMPAAAIAATQVDFVGTVREIAEKICKINGVETNAN